MMHECADAAALSLSQAGGVTTGFLVEHEADVAIPAPTAPSAHLLALAAYTVLSAREGG